MTKKVEIQILERKKSSLPCTCTLYLLFINSTAEMIIWSKEANLYAFPLQGKACICLRRIEIFRVNAENTILAHILRTQLIIHSRALCIYFENTIVYVIYHNNTYKYHSIHKLSSYYVVYTQNLKSQNI